MKTGAAPPTVFALKQLVGQNTGTMVNPFEFHRSLPLVHHVMVWFG